MHWNRLALPIAVSLVCCVPAEVSELDEETRDLLKRSGAIEAIPFSGIPAEGNMVVGKLDLTYDDTQTPDRPFRMGMMVAAENGDRIKDFFHDIAIPEEPSQTVGHGNFRGIVPRIFAMHAGNDDDVGQFSNDFPNYIDTSFPLTVKEFQNDAFFFENAPAGRYYIWCQTGFDGNRVFQFPFMFELHPTNGKINRFDITIENWIRVFHTL